jgi:glutamine amidotransferase
MCRLLAYLGPPVTLDALLLDPPHSLLRQSWAPRHQTHGVVNADGFGVGWYDPARRPEPARYRSAQPMWADRNLPSLAPLISTGAVLAAVRSATPPSPVEETAAPPYTAGPWLFAHNGAVDGFFGAAGVALRRAVSDRRLAGVESATDAELLFALVLDRLDAGQSAGEALADVISQVSGRLNLMLTDGVQVVATVWGESLFTRAGSGVVVASEPFDDAPEWAPVPDRTLVTATAESLRTESL